MNYKCSETKLIRKADTFKTKENNIWVYCYGDIHTLLRCLRTGHDALWHHVNWKKRIIPQEESLYTRQYPVDKPLLYTMVNTNEKCSIGKSYTHSELYKYPSCVDSNASKLHVRIYEGHVLQRAN